MDTTNIDKEDLDVPTILRVKSPSSQIEEPEDEEPENSFSEKHPDIAGQKRRWNIKNRIKNQMTMTMKALLF